MEIKINLSLKDAKHLATPHSFYDCCSQADNCLRLVQRQIDKKLKAKQRRKHET